MKWITENWYWISLPITLVASAVLSGVVSWRVARGTHRSAQRSQDRRDAHLRLREALASYREWLTSLVAMVDLFDRRGFAAKAQESLGQVGTGRLDDDLETLLAGRGSGAELVRGLEDGLHDVPGLNQDFIATTKSVVVSVAKFYAASPLTYAKSKAGDSKMDLYIRALARDSWEIGELDAAQVDLALRFTSDLRRQLEHDYARSKAGIREVRDADGGAEADSAGRLVRVEGGRLVYAGPIPFRSPEYVAALEKPPWERNRGQVEAVSSDSNEVEE